MSKVLQSQRILLVEDEWLVALELQRALEAVGASVTVARSVRDALRLVHQGFSAAVLDVFLHGWTVFSVADRLSRRGVPLIFHSGRSEGLELMQRFPSSTILRKPAQTAVLINSVQRATNSASHLAIPK